MTLFAIRDDDTSAWTEPGHLASVYDRLWGRDIPVSLSVIPQAVRSFHPGDRDRFYQGSEAKPLHENADLVAFLRPLIKSSRVAIMQHGFDHSYAVGEPHGAQRQRATEAWLRQLRAAARGAPLVWEGEYVWKDAARLAEETVAGKAYLETHLDCAVRVFVPPSNQIAAAGVKAVAAAGMDLSGIMGRGIDRPFSAAYLTAYARRWAFRLSRGGAYPFVLDLGTHRELRAYSLTPASSYDGLVKSLRFCHENGAPFVVATHHWELFEHPDLHEQLLRLCDTARGLTCEFATVAECFERGAA